jgi:hypothetical protein
MIIYIEKKSPIESMLKYKNEKKKFTDPMNRQSYEEGSNDSSPQLLLVNFNPLLYIYYFWPLDLSKHEEEEEIKFIVTKSGHSSKKYHIQTEALIFNNP